MMVCVCVCVYYSFPGSFLDDFDSVGLEYGPGIRFLANTSDDTYLQRTLENTDLKPLA